MSTHELKNTRLQYACWEDLPADIQTWFASLMGNRPERGKGFYELYFYWYNITHELGHVLRAYYGTGTVESRPWDEEIAANHLAVAYWHARNEDERLSLLGDWVREARATLPDPLPPGEERSRYFNTHYVELGSNPPAYGHYQLGMLLEVLEQPMNLQQALGSLVTPEVREGTLANPPTDVVVDSDLPHRTVNDMREHLAAYGVKLPELQVVCSYSPMIQFVQWD